MSEMRRGRHELTGRTEGARVGGSKRLYTRYASYLWSPRDRVESRMELR